jgi:hypothetical protein
LKHLCRPYGVQFAFDLSALALPNCHYACRAQRLTVRLVADDGLSDEAARCHPWRGHRVFVPYATIQNGVEEKSESDNKS